jgi:hypothetical protein
MYILFVQHILPDIPYTSVEIRHSGCTCLVVSSFGFNCCLIVLVVLNTILELVFQNNFVIILVSEPQYVNVAHFVFCVSCEALVRGSLYF